MKKHYVASDLVLCGLRDLRRGNTERAAKFFQKAAESPDSEEFMKDLDEDQETAFKATAAAKAKKATLAASLSALAAAKKAKKKGKKKVKAAEDTTDDLEIDDLLETEATEEAPVTDEEFPGEASDDELDTLAESDFVDDEDVLELPEATAASEDEDEEDEEDEDEKKEEKEDEKKEESRVLARMRQTKANLASLRKTSK